MRGVRLSFDAVPLYMAEMRTKNPHRSGGGSKAGIGTASVRGGPDRPAGAKPFTAKPSDTKRASSGFARPGAMRVAEGAGPRPQR